MTTHAAAHVHSFDSSHETPWCYYCGKPRCDACGGTGSAEDRDGRVTGTACAPCRGEGVDADEEDGSISQRNAS